MTLKSIPQQIKWYRKKKRQYEEVKVNTVCKLFSNNEKNILGFYCHSVVLRRVETELMY